MTPQTPSPSTSEHRNPESQCAKTVFNHAAMSQGQALEKLKAIARYLARQCAEQDVKHAKIHDNPQEKDSANG